MRLEVLSIIAFLFFIIHADAQESGSLTDVHSYEFEIEINDSTNIISGTARILITLNKPTKSFSLDLYKKKGEKGMKVSRVLMNGLPSCYHFGDDDKVYVKNNVENWPINTILEVQIDYFGIPKDGLIISDNKFGTRSFFADNWPNRAHHWIPVIDHPSDKAKVEFKIISPEHYEVIASGKLIGTNKLDGKRKSHHFKTKVEIPTKVMVFGASDFKITNYDPIDSIQVSSWIFEENQSGEMDYLSASDALTFFKDTIGEYLYSKLANVQSKTRYGGMENAGNIFYFENSVNGKRNIEALIAHEVAHHWFGNAVTEKDWPHIWLSEGFATYLTNLYFEDKYGEEVFRRRMIKERDQVIKFGNKRNATVVDSTIQDLMNLLNPNSYQKGAWILHMIRQRTGDDDFFRILQTFYNRYKFSNADSEDFIEIVEEVSNNDFTRFFEQWLYYSVNPDLNISWFIEKNVLYLEVEQLQKNRIFEMELEISDGKNVYQLPINKRIHTFFINEFMSSKPSFDPGIKLLFSYSDKNKKFTVKDPQKIDSKANLVEKGDELPNINPGHMKLLKPGDLLFQDLDCGPLCEAIESVTEGYKGSNFSHVAMITEINDNNAIVFEAIGGAVKKTRLEDFLNRSFDEQGRPKVMVGRIIEEPIVLKAIEEVAKYEGKKYDDVFDISNESYYCSELLYFSFLDDGKPIFNLFPMTFKNPETKEFDPAWMEYYKQLETDIPEGAPGLNPGGISRSPYVKVLYKFGDPSGYRPNQKSTF